MSLFLAILGIVILSFGFSTTHPSGLVLCLVGGALIGVALSVASEGR